jgi:hypothetical protein
MKIALRFNATINPIKKRVVANTIGFAASESGD